MAAISDRDLRLHLDRRLSGLKNTRAPWDPHADQLARYMQARMNRFIRSAAQGRAAQTADNWKKGWVNDKLFNSRAVMAAEVLGNGMSAGLCSPSQPWFSLQTENPELMNSQRVKAYLDGCEKVIYALFARCGFYPAATTGFWELGIFGSESCLMTPHWDGGAACYQQTWGEYYLGQNDALKTDTIYRHADMTVSQIYARWPNEVSKFSRKVTEAYDASKYDMVIPLMHAIEPNLERVYGRLDRTNMDFRSVYWEPGNDDAQAGIISFGGFHDKPFWAPRWSTVGSDVYASYCPGMRALTEARKVQLQELRKQQATDYVIKPVIAVPSTIQGGRPTLNPGSIITTAPGDQSQVGVAWSTPYQAIDVLRQDVNDIENRIDEALYNPIFRAFSNMEGSAYQNLSLVARKYEEQLTQLGPVVDRAVTEKIVPAVELAYGIAQRSGMLAHLEVPEELEDEDFKVIATGILAQAQKLIGLNSIERGMGFVGGLVAVDPNVIDNVDMDGVVQEYFSVIDMPAKAIASEEVRDGKRQQRAAAQQQEKLMAAMPAVKDGADAARLLSETDTGDGRTALQALMPGV